MLKWGTNYEAMGNKSGPQGTNKDWETYAGPQETQDENQQTNEEKRRNTDLKKMQRLMNNWNAGALRKKAGSGW